MTSSSVLSPAVGSIIKELAEMRHLVQFPEEIACILTEQEQQLYQRVREIHTHTIKCDFGCSILYFRYLICHYNNLVNLCKSAGFPPGLPLFPYKGPGQS